jgi:hypothetical protein
VEDNGANIFEKVTFINMCLGIDENGEDDKVVSKVVV